MEQPTSTEHGEHDSLPPTQPEQVIDLLSLDDSNHEHDVAAEAPLMMMIQQLRGVLPQIPDDGTAQEVLEAVQWNLERAIGTWLDQQQQQAQSPPLKRMPDSVPPHQPISHHDNSSILLLRPRKNDTQPFLPLLEQNPQQDPVILSTAVLAESDYGSVSENSIGPASLSPNDVPAPKKKHPENYFCDADFPPSHQSLDGRKRNDEHGNAVVVYCGCGLIAAAHQVQSEGPNYGRFYLACGRRRPKKSRQRMDDRDHEKVDTTITKPAADDTASNITKHPLVIRNPYAKKKDSNTKTIQNPTQLASESECNFFQWDAGGSQGAEHSSCYASRNNTIEWHHFGLENDCVLFRRQNSHPLSSTVRQGALGNCWFLSALAVVAEQPQLLRQILPHYDDGLNDQGRYQINLWLDGAWTAVTVDSYLPCLVEEADFGGRSSSQDGNKKRHRSLRLGSDERRRRWRGGIPLPGHQQRFALPAFVGAPERQIWAPLVEKAYAKAHGSYQQLSGGFVAEAWQDLTGAPTETVVLENVLVSSEEKDTFWMQLQSYHTAGCFMGLATARGGDGLVGGHAYSVLEVLELQDAVVGEQTKVTDYFHTSPFDSAKNPVASPSRNKRTAAATTTVRLLRIRNPWGVREWKGAWSAADTQRWTRNLRQRAGESHSRAMGDGTFFMSYHDVLQRFHHMDIAQTREGWVHSYCNGSFRRGCSDPMETSRSFYLLRVQQTGQAFLTIIQPKKRANTHTKYWYCDPSMILLKRRDGFDNNDWQCEAYILSGVQRQNHLEVFLEVGYTYCCVPFSCTLASSHRQLPLPSKVSSDHSDNDRSTLFRVTTYSSVKVAMVSADNDTEALTTAIDVGREAAVRLLHKAVLSRENSLTFAVAAKGVLTCIRGRGCLYFVALNGATDHFLSLKLSVDLPQSGLIVALGHAVDCYDIPPRSQKVCLVVAGNGKQQANVATHFQFHYVSSTVSARPSGGMLRNQNVSGRLRDFIALSAEGDLITETVAPDEIIMMGGAIVDTSNWIPQLGAF